MKKIFLSFFVLNLYLVLSAQTTKLITTDKMPGTNCNNVVHKDLLEGAQNRTPSECEVQFDWKQRTDLRNAFRKALQNFPSDDWEISDTAVKVLKEIGRHTEQNFFNLSYYFKIDLKPQSAAYQDWYKKYQAATDQWKSQPNEASYKKFEDFYYRMNNAIHIRVYVLVNSVSYSIYFMKGEQQVFTLPGASFAIRGPHTAALSGGDDTGMDACLILFGNQKPEIKKEPGGGASLHDQNHFPKNISHLTLQNISIRIECNNELLDKILKDTDWKTIANMVGK